MSAWTDVAAPPTWQELATLFLAERKRRHVSLRSVSAATGIPVMNLSRFERQENEPLAALFIAVWSWIVEGRA